MLSDLLKNKVYITSIPPWFLIASEIKEILCVVAFATASMASASPDTSPANEKI